MALLPFHFLGVCMILFSVTASSVAVPNTLEIIATGICNTCSDILSPVSITAPATMSNIVTEIDGIGAVIQQQFFKSVLMDDFLKMKPLSDIVPPPEPLTAPKFHPGIPIRCLNTTYHSLTWSEILLHDSCPWGFSNEEKYKRMMKVVRTRCTLAAIPINTAIALRGYFMMFSTVKWPVAVAMILKPVWIPIVMDAMEQMACKLFRIQCSAESAPPAEYAGGQSRGKWKTGEKARRV